MRIGKVTLKNFRAAADLTLDLDRITVCRAANGAGKTSLAYAIEWLLAGRNPLTDEAGKGADSLMLLGASEMQVSAEVFDPEIGEQDACKILRQRAKLGAGSVIVEPPDFSSSTLLGRDAEEWISVNLASSDVLRACLNSSRFISLNEKDQKSLLAAALAGQAVNVSEDLQKLMAEAGAMAVKTVNNHASADAAYKMFYSHRANLNLEIKGLGEIKAPSVPKEMPSSSDFTAKQLNPVREKKVALLVARSKRVSDHQAAKQQAYDNTLRELRQQRDKLSFRSEQKKDLQKAVAQRNALILDGVALAKVQDTLNSAAKIAELDKQIEQKKIAVGIAQAALDNLKDSKSHPDICPTCLRDWPHDKHSQDVARESKMAKQGELTTANAALKKLEDQRSKFGNLAEAKLQHETHKAAVLAVNAAEQELAKLKDAPDSIDTSGIDNQIAALKAQPPNLLDVPDTSALDKQLEEIEAKITKGEGMLKRIQETEGAVKQHEQLTSRKAALEKKVAAIQKVVDAFAEGGPIRSSLVGPKFEEFKAKLITGLSHFGFDCDLSLDPEYKFLVKTDAPGARALELRQLSRSQMLRFAVAFQCALAMATGLKLVVIDEADILLPTVRRNLQQAINASALDQAIILLAAEPTPISAASLPEGVSYIDLALNEQGRSIVAAHTMHA